MEKNKPISVAFEDIRNNPDFIEHSEYRFINDDLGMVISFQAMGFRLFRTQQPYRAKEGRIVRIMQGKGRISINLIEYEATAHDIIIIPDNSLIEISEVSPDYEFQVIMPTANFLPVLQNSILSEAYTRNGIRLSCNNEEWAHISSFFSLLWNILHCLPYRRGAVQHLIVSLLYNLKYIHEHTCKSTPARLSRQEELFRRFIALVNQHSEPERQPQALDMLHRKEIDMVVNIPKNLTAGELDNGYKIRRAAIDLNIPLITNARLASAFINAFCTMMPDDLAIKSWAEYK